MFYVEIIIGVLLIILVIFQILNYFNAKKNDIPKLENRLCEIVKELEEKIENNIEDEFKRNRE